MSLPVREIDSFEGIPEGYYWLKPPDFEWEVVRVVLGSAWPAGSDDVLLSCEIRRKGYRIGPRLQPPTEGA